MKTNKKHYRTPGPWHLKKKGWMGGGPYVIGPANRVVADCNLEDEEGTYRKIENMENASFIAKAPRMFDLLGKAYQLLEESSLEGSDLPLEIDGKIWDKEMWIGEYNKLISKIKDAH